jgi:hypothetical protein
MRMRFLNPMPRIACLLLFILIGCATQRISFDRGFNKINVGMDEKEVLTLIGEPALKEGRENLMLWHYSESDGRFVQFKSNKVVAFGRDDSTTFFGLTGLAPSANATSPTTPSSTSPSPTSTRTSNSSSTALSSPALLGESCLKDKDCKSLNCHFKICSGPSNCQKKLGQICAIDNDCCEGRCDFGYCKKH